MAEKNRTTHSKADFTGFVKANCPTVKLKVVRVTTENIRMEFKAYLVLNSDLISFLKTAVILVTQFENLLGILSFFEIIGGQNHYPCLAVLEDNLFHDRNPLLIQIRGGLI